MGLCVSKSAANNDYATYSKDPEGKLVLNRNLVDVAPGENVQSRLDRLDRKAVKQFMRGTLPYQDFDEARAHERRQKFQAAAPSRAPAASSAPAEITFLRTDSEGCLIQTTVVNPSEEDRSFAERQKAAMLQRYGADGLARLRPVGFERSVKQDFTIEV